MVFMSSEESGTEDDEEVLIVKDLLWRSNKVDRFFKNLDEKEEKSSQAKRQSKKRIRGYPGMASDRPKPEMCESPSWVFAEYLSRNTRVN